MGTDEYTLTKEDIGQRLTFVYVPVNFEGKFFHHASVLLLFFFSLLYLILFIVICNVPVFSTTFRAGREAYVCNFPDS